MSAISDSVERHANVAYFSFGTPTVQLEKRTDGTAVARGLKVFRSGTFRDSAGVQHTFTNDHLTQMVFNYKLLRDRGSLQNVPVREDHNRSQASVVGYFSDLRQEGNFLVADFDITEPSAVGKIERGTFRGRSAEVGMFETNDEALYWPVMLGTAFVDIPAVEGLFSKNPSNSIAKDAVFDGRPVALIHSEEPNVPQSPEEWLAAANYAQWVEAATFAQACDDWVRAATYAQAIEDAAKTAKFRVNGSETVDFAAVQTHIDSLERFAADTKDANRRAFVKSLVSDKKIAVTQEENLTALALSLGDDQYESFVASYSAAPVIPLFEKHGGRSDSQTTDTDNEDDELAVAEATVTHLRRSGMSEEQLKNTPSFKRLEALKAKAS